MSPRRLDLQILCKSGASIERILDSCDWGTLPLIVRFKGHPKTKSLPKNIAIALRYPDRVREIDIGLTSTTAGPIVAAIVKTPFPTLECVRITIKDVTGPSLLFRNVFLGGSAPCLREITLDGIGFPFLEIKQVLSSTNNLVELHLSKISESSYFSVDTLVTALSTSVQLRRLTVGFHYPASLPTKIKTSPPPQRTTFPSLISLRFHGATEYIEEFVSWVDFPALRDINIMLFNMVFFEIPQFCQSIHLLNTLKSPTQVIVQLSATFVGVYITQDGRHVPYGHCFLGTSCSRLDWQLSFATYILTQFSHLLSSVRSLVINTRHDLSGSLTGEEDVDSTQWLELFQPFTHAKEFRAFEQLVPGIVQALVAEDADTGVLPQLTQLSLEGYRKSSAAVEAVEQFVAARRLSGRTIHLSN